MYQIAKKVEKLSSVSANSPSSIFVLTVPLPLLSDISEVLSFGALGGMGAGTPWSSMSISFGRALLISSGFIGMLLLGIFGIALLGSFGIALIESFGIAMLCSIGIPLIGSFGIALV